MEKHKVYVTAEAKFDVNGNIRPVAFYWIDDRRYDIEKVLDIVPLHRFVKN